MNRISKVRWPSRLSREKNNLRAKRKTFRAKIKTSLQKEKPKRSKLSKELRTSPTLAIFKTRIRKLDLSDLIDNNSSCCKLCKSWTESFYIISRNQFIYSCILVNRCPQLANFLFLAKYIDMLIKFSFIQGKLHGKKKKTHGKKNNHTAKEKSIKNVLSASKKFCRESSSFCREVFLFAARLILFPWQWWATVQRWGKQQAIGKWGYTTESDFNS